MKGELNPNEFHPAARDALTWILSLKDRLPLYQESLSSCSIEGNRTAEICSETLRRLLAKEPVSDRYLLGLAWTLKAMEERT